MGGWVGELAQAVGASGQDKPIMSCLSDRSLAYLFGLLAARALRTPPLDCGSPPPSLPPQVFPNLRVIHQTRDGRDVALSNLNSTSRRMTQPYQRHYVKLISGAGQ